MSKVKRLELIRLIEERRNSYVLAYVFSDRPNVVVRGVPEIVREMYDLLCEFKPLDKKKDLDLFLYSCGGGISLPWQVVTMIRELFRRFNVIIPYKAHGAATMIALGADTIVMGEKGELSPIDVSIANSTNSKGLDSTGKSSVSLEDVSSFFSLLERLGKLREKQRIDAFMQAVDKLPPLLLGSINRAFEQNRSVATRLMETRKRSFRKATNSRIINRLFSDFLMPHSCISRSEAIHKIGLKHVQPAGDLEPIIWELLTSYESEMKMKETFYPEDVMAQLNGDEEVFPDHKIVYLETEKRTRVYRLDVKMKKVREHPPSMEFNPQIALPPIELPSQFQEGQAELRDFIKRWLQGNLPDIVYQCFERFKKGLPVVAYERVHLNRRWIDE